MSLEPYWITAAKICDKAPTQERAEDFGGGYGADGDGWGLEISDTQLYLEDEYGESYSIQADSYNSVAMDLWWPLGDEQEQNDILMSRVFFLRGDETLFLGRVGGG